MLRKWTAAVIALMLTAAILLSCAPGDTDKGYYSFTDARGRDVRLTDKPNRVVSLMGSYAETWRLAGGDLCGVTSDVIEEQRFEVEEGMQVVGGVKEPNMEQVLALNPQFVLLSTDIAGHLRAAQLLDTVKVPYAFFKVEQFSDYLAMLKICTDITGRADLYQENGLAVQAQIEAVLQSTPQGAKIKVLFLRAYSTGIKAKADDSMVSHMLYDFNCVNIAKLKPSLLTDLSMEVVIGENPDVVLATSMGDEDKALNTFKQWIKRPELASLAAVNNDRCYMLPKALFHYKPNNRWGEAYEYLEKVFFA